MTRSVSLLSCHYHQPYVLVVGARWGYKNAVRLYRVLSQGEEGRPR